ncbi:MAG: adenylyltransferase/cytidyltransferase family protein [Clostridia bacterium]|nr:adenylyltransferase/cytidyltransferase family protein [Clostridia bacterium]
MRGKYYGLGVIVGRFQGIHAGHEMMIDSALGVCSEVAVFIGSSQESGTEKNPFTYEMRRDMLTKLYGKKIKIFPLPDIGVGNCAEWGEYVTSCVKEKCGKAPDVCVSGKESRRASWLEGKSGASVAELYVPKTVEMSATRMRGFFIENDLESWKNFTPPKLWDMYDELRQTVLSAQGNTDTSSL